MSQADELQPRTDAFADLSLKFTPVVEADGELMHAAEREGYQVFVTTGSSIKHQQDLTRRRFATVVLLSTGWPRIQRAIGPIVEAIAAALPGADREVEIP